MDRITLSEVNVMLGDKYKIAFTPHPNVNIIVGINGSGKTTLLSEIEKSLTKGTYIFILYTLYLYYIHPVHRQPHDTRQA